MIEGKLVTLRHLNDGVMDLKVGELINVNSWTWIKEKLRGIFNSTSLEGVLAIPLVRNSGVD